MNTSSQSGEHNQARRERSPEQVVNEIVELASREPDGSAIVGLANLLRDSEPGAVTAMDVSHAVTMFFDNPEDDTSLDYLGSMQKPLDSQSAQSAEQLLGYARALLEPEGLPDQRDVEVSRIAGLKPGQAAGSIQVDQYDESGALDRSTAYILPTAGGPYVFTVRTFERDLEDVCQLEEGLPAASDESSPIVHLYVHGEGASFRDPFNGMPITYRQPS